MLAYFESLQPLASRPRLALVDPGPVAGPGVPRTPFMRATVEVMPPMALWGLRPRPRLVVAAPAEAPAAARRSPGGGR